MVSVKLKIVNFILRSLTTITTKVLFYQAKYNAGDNIENIANKQSFDLRSMADRVKNVMIHDQEIIDKRWDICKGCEFLSDNDRCEKCGCFMKVKTRIATVACPINKWGKEYKFMEGKAVNGTHITS